VEDFAQVNLCKATLDELGISIHNL